MHRILILNGTSMAAIQALTVLDPKKYQIHVCDSDPKCWGRFHRNCAHFFQSPHFASNPRGLFFFVLRRLQDTHYDAILPVHEEGLLLARYRDVFGKYTRLFLDDADAFNVIMNKRLCLELAQSLGIPIPEMTIVHSLDEIEGILDSPSYLKLPYGTSSSGVRYIKPEHQTTVPKSFAHSDELIVQKEICGDLCVLQSAFKNGNLIASHQYRAVSQGYGGGASYRLSIDREDLREYAARLGHHLKWNGPLMLDFIAEEQTDRPFLIEGNPRIGETYNATLSGLNICELLIELTLDQAVSAGMRSRAGIRSHQMFTEVMAAVKRGDTLKDRWSTMLDALTSSGRFRSSTDELIHPIEDPISLAATVAMAVGLPFITHGVAAYLDSRATKSMAATPETIREILDSDWYSEG